MTEETAVAEKAPSHTVARDARVLAHVQAAGEAGVSRKAVAAHIHTEEPNVSASQAYLTLSRLRAAGKIKRVHADGEHKWVAEA